MWYAVEGSGFGRNSAEVLHDFGVLGLQGVRALSRVFK